MSSTGDLTRLAIHPHDIIGNEQARSIAAHYLGQTTPVTRNSLIKWREKRGFPQPLDTPRAGVELWDAREVRAWCEKHAEWRRQQDQGPDPSNTRET
jgi:predicted DNA-binding transcriptional regulator AlpA